MEVLLCIKFRMYDACIYVLYGCVCLWYLWYYVIS